MLSTCECGQGDECGACCQSRASSEKGWVCQSLAHHVFVEQPSGLIKNQVAADQVDDDSPL